MEPRIQYAQTADGVSIAFWTMGEGMPLVYMPMIPWSHVQWEWEQAPWRPLYQQLADRRNLVRYDGRGSGLSERDVKEFSLDVLLLDLEAVVERLQLEKFALLAPYHAGPLGITYAARYPERVSHLILRASYARASEYMGSPQAQGVLGLLDKDWELFTETAARLVFGWSDEERARQGAAFFRESATQDVAMAAYRGIAEFDVSALLPELRTPTLVIHVREYRYPDVDPAKRLTAQIPDARLAVVQDYAGMASAIDEFLGEGEEAQTKAARRAGTVHTILFTDMESSTALTQRLGDAKGQELVRAHNAIVRDALKAHGGSEIKHTGDGIMASFSSASGALACAIAIQRAVGERHAEPVEASLRVRIGLNAGEPVAEEQDLFGTAVQLARRICDHAEPGQILAPIVVRELAAGKGFLFSDRGETALRGFEDPVRLYEVRWREDGS